MTNFQLLMLSPNLLKSQIPILVRGGGGLVMTNFQLLMHSSNLLKSQSPIMVRGVSNDQFPTFDAESKPAEIPKSHYSGGRGLAISNFQLLMLSPYLLKSQSPIVVGGGGLTMTNFQLLMLSPNLLKSQIPILVRGGVGDDQFPTFDAEFKSAKIPKSHYGEGGQQWPISNFWCWVQIS